MDFYFDIISPYAYIAYKKILKINDINFKLKPIFLGGLHNLVGITAPAFNKFKMKNMQNDCELVAKKNNISFKWNSKFPINSLNIMRGYLCVTDNKKEEYLNFSITFDKEKIHALFYNKGVSYSEISDKELFVLPIHIKKNEIFIFLVFAADIMSCTVGDSNEWGILIYVIDRFLLVIQ